LGRKEGQYMLHRVNMLRRSIDLDLGNLMENNSI
jgi:hypothetical protein